MIGRVGEHQQRHMLLPDPFLALVDKLDPKEAILSRKDILILKGDNDKLVPWSASEAFVSRLPDQCKEVVGYPAVGHSFTETMRQKAAQWIVSWIEKHS